MPRGVDEGALARWISLSRLRPHRALPPRAAVLGQPQQSAQAKAIHAPAGDGIPGTMGAGQAVTDGPVYRPISPTHGQFPGIFDGFSVHESVRRGHYPRVALTFETYGATIPCWKVRATIWQSALSHHDERFELCDAPLTGKDDLGQPMVIGDPTLPLSGVIQSRHILPAPGLTVFADNCRPFASARVNRPSRVSATSQEPRHSR